MNRLLFLIPLVALVGCDQQSPSTSPAKTGVVTRTEGRSKPTAEAPAGGSATEQATKADGQDPPFRAPEIEEKKDEPPPEKAPPIPEAYKPLNKKKTIFFEKAEDGTRRVHLLAEVCLREGPLEVFLCKLSTKEHESILNVDADAREIHFALVAAGATPGHPVQYIDPKTGKPDYKLPTGTTVKVTLTYREKGKVKTAKAGDWVQDMKTKKTLDCDWVFAGSRFFKDPEGKNPDYYLANNGEVITVSNFPDSMLDVPIKSSKDDADRLFVADTAKIPPLRTPVLVTLEPVVEKKK